MSLNVGMPKFFQAVDRELKRTPLADWKTYLRWQLIDGYAQYLSKPFVDEDFRMTAVLTGAQELQARWLRVLRAEDEALGFAIGQLYVVQKFPPAAKEAAAAMVSNIRDALRTDLKTLAWMTPSSRDAAIAEIGTNAAAYRLSGSLARLCRTRDRPRSVCAQRAARQRIRTKARARQDRQARRSQRVVHDAANGECLLRPLDEQLERAGGNPAAAVFRCELA